MVTRLHDEPSGTRVNHPTSLVMHRWKARPDILHHWSATTTQDVWYCERHDDYVYVPPTGHGAW